MSAPLPADVSLCLFCGLPMGTPDGCDCPAPTVRRRTTRALIGLGDLIADVRAALDGEDQVRADLGRLPGIDYRPAGCACGVCRG